MYKRNIEMRSRNHCYRVKAVGVKYFKCAFGALVSQHVKRVRCVILSSVASLAPPYFYTLCN